MNFKLLFFIILVVISSTFTQVFADGEDKLSGSAIDRFAEAQEKLLQARGSYKTIKMQEDAIENMRKATKLSLKASKLRAKAEKLQNKADALVNKANLTALSRGLYITNPLAPVMMQPPPAISAEPQNSPVTPPVPGQQINITIPKPEEVSYNKDAFNDANLPQAPDVENYQQ